MLTAAIALAGALLACALYAAHERRQAQHFKRELHSLLQTTVEELYERYIARTLAEENSSDAVELLRELKAQREENE